MEWTTSAAQHYARAGRLEVWIHAYLATGEWANPGLSTGPRRQQRWWRSPMEVALMDVERVCGPEVHMEYRPRRSDVGASHCENAAGSA
jgi:hypothetical protein